MTGVQLGCDDRLFIKISRSCFFITAGGRTLKKLQCELGSQFACVPVILSCGEYEEENAHCTQSLYMRDLRQPYDQHKAHTVCTLTLLSSANH